MTLAERRVKIIEKIIDKNLDDQIAMEVGIEIKKTMILQMGDSPTVMKVDEAIRMEEAELAIQPKVLEILNRKLKKAKEAIK